MSNRVSRDKLQGPPRKFRSHLAASRFEGATNQLCFHSNTCVDREQESELAKFDGSYERVSRSPFSLRACLLIRNGSAGAS